MGALLLTLDELRAQFARRPDALLDVAQEIAGRVSSSGGGLLSAQLVKSAQDLLNNAPDPSTLPLWGIPFVVGGNVDVTELPTSVGIPGLDYAPDSDATIVECLRAAGAILVGKAPVDPLGLDASASGVAFAVAEGLAVFGVASDRTGRASVIAASHGVTVVKPSPSAGSLDGLFAAAPELDSLCFLASDLRAGVEVLRTIEVAGKVPPASEVPTRTVGILGGLTSSACRDIAERLGLVPVSVDVTPFAEIAALMEADIWLALKLDDIEIALIEVPELFPKYLERRLRSAFNSTASDMVRARRRLSLLREQVDHALTGIDLLCVPADARLAGFVNACGLAAVVLPEGMMLVGRNEDRLVQAVVLAASKSADAYRRIDIPASSPLAHQ